MRATLVVSRNRGLVLSPYRRRHARFVALASLAFGPPHRDLERRLPAIYRATLLKRQRGYRVLFRAGPRRRRSIDRRPRRRGRGGRTICDGARGMVRRA